MTESKNRQWILKARPAGKLTGEEFRWTEAPIPLPSDGQVLIQTLWLSVDPAQRIWMARDSYKPAVPLGDVMQSFAVGQVVDSRHPDLKPGDIVRGEFGWQDYVVTAGKGFGGLQKVPPGIPPNLALGLFGLNGLTAYIGIAEVGKVTAGETVVVSGAAGATGSVAGQIAKLKGCRVIGTAGGEEKCDWLVDEAHFDAAIDYKSEDVGARLSELCPSGIDVFFDNVGGELLQRGPRSDQHQRAHRAMRLDLEIRRRHAASGPGELFQSGGQAGAHGGLHRAGLSRAGSRGPRGAGPLAAGRQPRAQGRRSA